VPSKSNTLNRARRSIFAAMAPGTGKSCVLNDFSPLSSRREELAGQKRELARTWLKQG